MFLGESEVFIFHAVIRYKHDYHTIWTLLKTNLIHVIKATSGTWLKLFKIELELASFTFLWNFRRIFTGICKVAELRWKFSGSWQVFGTSHEFNKVVKKNKNWPGTLLASTVSGFELHTKLERNWFQTWLVDNRLGRQETCSHSIKSCLKHYRNMLRICIYI